MSNVRDTSFEAYDFVRALGITGAQRERIAVYLYRRDSRTRQEISKGTGITINAVCGRVNELVKDYKLEEEAPRTCSITGRQAHPLRLPMNAYQREPTQELLL
jgi:predicted ArsR family transcriptional regulator